MVIQTEHALLLRTHSRLYRSRLLQVNPCLEAFLGATLHGAQAIGLEDEIGSIRTGKKADLIVWDISDLSEIPYYVSNHPIRHVIKNGKLVFGS